MLGKLNYRFLFHLYLYDAVYCLSGMPVQTMPLSYLCMHFVCSVLILKYIYIDVSCIYIYIISYAY